MTIRTKSGRAVAPIEVLELTPLRYRALLTKVTLGLPDAPLVLADLVGPLTGTIYSLHDPGFPAVNSVENTDLIATNRATLDAAGELTLLLNDADNGVLDPTLPVERHGVRIKAPYSLSPPLTGVFELEVRVRNRALAP
jgi:hypothetical protein